AWGSGHGPEHGEDFTASCLGLAHEARNSRRDVLLPKPRAPRPEPRRAHPPLGHDVSPRADRVVDGRGDSLGNGDASLAGQPIAIERTTARSALVRIR